jgi:hypothetical protein
VKTLKLTSPYMRGDDVTKMQRALVQKHYLNDAVDGVYGPLSAQAAHRAKYWLGYTKVDQTAGDVLYAYLTGARKPTEAMTKRAAARKQQAAEVPIRQKALDWLTTKIGDKEQPPNSNRISWASEWYGLIGPWCAMAVTRAYVEAGSQAFKRTQRYAYCPYIVNDAHAGANNLALTTDPKPGDLVLFDWERNKVSDHVGLFVKWISKPTQFETVEGNTAVGNDSNGGEVMRRKRTRDQVQAFVHVGK